MTKIRHELAPFSSPWSTPTYPPRSQVDLDNDVVEMGLDSPIPALPPKRRAKLLSKLGEHAQLSHCRTPGESAPRFVQTPLRARARKREMHARPEQTNRRTDPPTGNGNEIFWFFDFRLKKGRVVVVGSSRLDRIWQVIRVCGREAWRRGGGACGLDLLCSSRPCEIRGEPHKPHPAAGKEGGDVFRSTSEGHTATSTGP